MVDTVYTNLDNLELSGNLIVDGTATFTGGIEEDADITLANGKALQTDTTTAHTAKLKAYDVDGTAYKTFLTLTNGNTPSMAIAAPSGGTVTVDGSSVGTVAANTISVGNIFQDIKVSSAQLDSTSTALASIAGLSTTVVPGTYKFSCILPGTADGTGGIKYAFKYTTTVVSSIEAIGVGNTASAVATQHTTTTTDQALLFDQAAAVIFTRIEGSMVVGTGGTIALQMAEHAATSTASTYVGATMQFTRIA